MASLPPIACLLGKIKEGKLSEKDGKALIKQIESLQPHVAGESEQIAAKKVFERQQLTISAKAKGRQVYEKQASELVEDLPEDAGAFEANEFIKDYVGARYNSNLISNNAMAAGIIEDAAAKGEVDVMKLNHVDNLEISRSYFGEPSKTRGFNDVAKSIVDSHNYQRRLLRENGMPIADLQPGQMPINIRPGKMAGVTPKNLLDSMEMLDREYLISNIPFYHEIGSLEELSHLMHIIYTGSPKAATKEFTKKGYNFSPQQLLAHFKAAAVVTDIKAYKHFSSVYGSGRLEPVVEAVTVGRSNSATIARLQSFGDPDQFIDVLGNQIESRGLMTRRNATTLERYRDYVTGRTDNYAFANSTVTIGNHTINPTKFLGTFQSLTSLKTAFSGPISAVFLDPVSSASTLKKLGMTDNVVWSWLTNFFNPKKLANPSKEEAAVLKFHLKSFSDELVSATRHLSEGAGSQAAAKFTRTISEISGVERITRGNRRIAANAISLQIANFSEMSWKELNAQTRKYFKVVGIRESDWDIIRNFDWQEVDGVKTASPWQLFEAGLYEQGQKLNAFYEYSMENSVPMFGVARDEFMKRTLKDAGSFKVFLLKSIMSFTGPVASQFENFIRPAIANKEALKLFGTFAVLATVAGNGQQVADSILRGETVNFSDPELYLEGFVRGGAASILGDVMAVKWRDWQRLDSMLGKRVLGVTFGTYRDLAKAFDKAGTAILSDKDNASEKLGLDLLKIGEGYLTNIWWAKGAYERFMAPSLRRFVGGEEAIKKEHRKNKRMAREGTRFWLNP